MGAPLTAMYFSRQYNYFLALGLLWLPVDMHSENSACSRIAIECCSGTLLGRLTATASTNWIWWELERRKIKCTDERVKRKIRQNNFGNLVLLRRNSVFVFLVSRLHNMLRLILYDVMKACSSPCVRKHAGRLQHMKQIAPKHLRCV